MKYSEPSSPLWSEEDVPEFDGNISYYMIRDDSSRRLSEVFSGDFNSYICVNTGETPVIIEYFSDLCEGSEGMVGCWHDRRAVVCGNIYFVQEFTSATGPVLYGPFEK